MVNPTVAIREPKLTPTQNAFCMAFVRLKNASAAYKESYNTKGTPTVANTESSKLMAKPHIKARIAALLQKTEARTILSAQQILEELTLLASKKYEHRDRLKALELLGRYRKLFTDKVEGVLTGKDGAPLPQTLIQVITTSENKNRLNTLA